MLYIGCDPKWSFAFATWIIHNRWASTNQAGPLCLLSNNWDGHLHHLELGYSGWTIVQPIVVGHLVGGFTCSFSYPLNISDNDPKVTCFSGLETSVVAGEFRRQRWRGSCKLHFPEKLLSWFQKKVKTKGHSQVWWILMVDVPFFFLEKTFLRWDTSSPWTLVMPGDKNCLSPLAVGKNISDELVMNWNWVDAGRCCQDPRNMRI